MKRIITFMMALALVLSLSVTAFAAVGTDGTITITNTTIGDTYEVYKIFDATYDNDSDAVTYTIDSSNPFFAKMFGADGKTNNECFEYYAETGVVKLKEGVTNSDLFAYLTVLIENVDPTAGEEATATIHTFSGLNYGYYVIARENGNDNTVTITNVNKDATVIDKNQLPGGDFDKESDKTTAAVGDTIIWTLSFTATNYDDDEKVLSYTIKDTLNPTGWAAIDLDNITVTVGTKTLEEVTDWTLESSSADGFEINIPWMNDDNFIYDSTAKVKVTYSATVKDAAVANNPTTQDNKNNADLDWTTKTGVKDGPDDDTDTEVYNLGFTKVDGTDTTKTLAGAEFLLTDAEGNDINVSGVNGLYIVDPDGTSNRVVTPEGGAVVIQGLAAGTYRLTEDKAPAGYNLLTDAIEVEVKEGAGDEITIGDDTYYVNNTELNIENNSGVELPSTGGKGTIMMITIGTVVAIAFAVLLITQKKMSIYHD